MSENTQKNSNFNFLNGLLCKVLPLESIQYEINFL